MTETIIDAETGEVVTQQASVPAIRHVGMPTPYQSAETGQIAEAIASSQAAMESPKRTKTGKIEGTSKNGKAYAFEYKYAPFEEVHRVIKAVFPQHGLMYQQGLVTRGEQYFVRTYVRHVSGEWTASDYPVIADRTGSQGFAGAVTYAKRNGLTLAVGIAAEDDDDGASAQAAAPEAKPAPTTELALARAAVSRIRREIADAAFLEELDATGIYGPNSIEDERMIKAQLRGPETWADLVLRDRKRRAELAPQPRSDDSELPALGEGSSDREYRI
jgi:hypothetical protein